MLGIDFHHFHEDDADKRDILPGSISKSEFYGLIKEIRKNFNIVNAPDWGAKCLENSAHVSNHICFTFDDNIRSQFTVAREVLTDLKTTAFFFIYTGMFHEQLPRLELYRHFITKYFDEFDAFFMTFLNLIEEQTEYKICDIYDGFPDEYLREYEFYTKSERLYRHLRDHTLKADYQRLMDLLVNRHTTLESLAERIWLTKAEIKQLSDEGNIVGLHSLSHHTDLASMPNEVQKKEYEINKRDLEEITQKTIMCVSYPNGSFNSYTILLMKQLGIGLGFTTQWQAKVENSLEMPRLNASVLRKRLQIGR